MNSNAVRLRQPSNSAVANPACRHAVVGLGGNSTKGQLAQAKTWAIAKGPELACAYALQALPASEIPAAGVSYRLVPGLPARVNGRDRIEYVVARIVPAQ